MDKAKQKQAKKKQSFLRHNNNNNNNEDDDDFRFGYNPRAAKVKAAAMASSSIRRSGGFSLSSVQELLPSTSCAFVTENAYAHILHLMAAALNPKFHEILSLSLTESPTGRVGNYHAAAPKSAAKMISNIHERHAGMKRPRPAHNVDCLRCMVNYVRADQIFQGFQQVRPSRQFYFRECSFLAMNGMANTR